MKQHPRRDIRASLGTLFRDRRGVAAVLFALMLPTLLLSTGAAVDFARVGMLKTSMQAVTDGAALAGASALCLSSGQTDATQAATQYYTKGTVPIARYATINTPTVTIPSSIEVTVTATATLNNTLMRLVGMSETVSVTSSAEGPAYTLQVTKTGGFRSSAYDSDSIYFYNASNGAVPTTVASMTRLYTNDSKIDPNYTADNAASKNIAVGGNDYVGFALVNITGGVTGYGSNGYGAVQGSTHIFYTSLPIPAQIAYPSPGTFYDNQQLNFTYQGRPYAYCQQNKITGTVTDWTSTETNSCTAHPCTEMNGNVVLENNLLTGTGSATPSCSTQSTSNLTCLQLYNSPVTFKFNDMGGGGDDFDYDDADFTVSCVPSTSGSTQPNAVILVQ